MAQHESKYVFVTFSMRRGLHRRLRAAAKKLGRGKLSAFVRGAVQEKIEGGR